LSRASQVQRNPEIDTPRHSTSYMSMFPSCFTTPLSIDYLTSTVSMRKGTCLASCLPARPRVPPTPLSTLKRNTKGYPSRPPPSRTPSCVGHRINCYHGLSHGCENALLIRLVGWVKVEHWPGQTRIRPPHWVVPADWGGLVPVSKHGR